MATSPKRSGCASSGWRGGNELRRPRQLWQSRIFPEHNQPVLLATMGARATLGVLATGKTTGKNSTIDPCRASERVSKRAVGLRRGAVVALFEKSRPADLPC
jgi:hypothetical protein